MEIEKILLDCKAVLLRPKNPFTYTSGNKGPIYCDCRLLMSHPLERKRIVDLFLEKISSLDFDVVAGVATAGIPWASFLAQKLGKPLIYVRGKAKEHGGKKQVEGGLSSGQKVLVVEELITTAGSVVNAVEAVRSVGGVVDDVLVLYTHELASGLESIKNVQCNVHALGCFSTLVSLALKKDIISEDDKDILDNWHKDPKGWTP